MANQYQQAIDALTRARSQGKLGSVVGHQEAANYGGTFGNTYEDLVRQFGQSDIEGLTGGGGPSGGSGQPPTGGGVGQPPSSGTGGPLTPSAPAPASIDTSAGMVGGAGAGGSGGMDSVASAALDLREGVGRRMHPAVNAILGQLKY